MNDDPTALGSVVDPWHDSFYQAIRESDAPALEALVTDDIVVMIANEPTLKGAHAVRGWFEDYFKKFKVEEVVVTQRSVIVPDAWGFEWGSHSIRILPINGNPFKDESRFLHVWQNQDRRWKLARMMWNSSNPIGIPLNRLFASMNLPRSE